MQSPTDIDYIEVDRETMIDFHGKYTFLLGYNLELFETEKVKDFKTNPTTGKLLQQSELEYIKFHDDCYRYTQDLDLTPEILAEFFKWYDESRTSGFVPGSLRTNPGTSQAYNLVRFFLTATDFQSHFKEFNPQDSVEETYERDLATRSLEKDLERGSWLLRHSSYNRPIGDEAKLKLKQSGIRYYVLSYVDKDYEILHMLFSLHLGHGWKYHDKWFTNFLDILEYMLYDQDIPYVKRIGTYFKTNPVHPVVNKLIA